MQKQPKYYIKYTKAENDNGTVWYTIQVHDNKNNLSWQFKQRYSHMLKLHEECQHSKWKNQLPEFPPRKLFGNTKPEFIQKRKKELENYYTILMKSVSLDEFPNLLKFFNTNKPKAAQKIKDQPKDAPNKSIPPKQKPPKRLFEEIVSKYEKEMIESNDYDNAIDDATHREYIKAIEKLNLKPQSNLLQKAVLPKAQKDNDSEYWAMFWNDKFEEKMNKLKKVAEQAQKIEKKVQKLRVDFVVAL